MTPSEIEVTYRQAKNKIEQLKILADENLCSVAEIKKVLVNTGKYVERGNGLYPVGAKAPQTEQVAKQTVPEKQTITDWKTAVEFLINRIAELTEIRDKAENELNAITTTLDSIRK